MKEDEIRKVVVRALASVAPEADYPRLSTLDGCVEYLAAKVAAQCFPAATTATVAAAWTHALCCERSMSQTPAQA